MFKFIEYCLYLNKIRIIFPMETKEMGQIITRRRGELSLDQKNLAELAGITVKTLYLIEKGTGNPSLNTLNKILDLLGLTIQVNIKKTSE